jgi:cell division septal protein FtsQ
LAFSGYFERTPTDKQDIQIPRWVFPAIGAALAVLFLWWFFTQAPWLRVKDIRIEGDATEETKAEIEKLAGQNILWLSVTSPEEVILENQPSIKEIQILRGIPDTLRVKLIERQPAMIWQVGEVWYTLDETGFVYREQAIGKKPDGTMDYPDTDLPVVVDMKHLPVKVAKTIVRPQFIAFINELQDRLPTEYNVRMVRAEVGETTFSTTVITDGGWRVLFDTTRNIDAQLKTLTKVLAAKKPEIKEYVDVRVRGWVYYK